LIATLPDNRTIRTAIQDHLLRFVLIVLFIACTPAQANSIRIAVISDLNESYGSTQYRSHVTKAIQRIIQLKPDLVLSTGDMVAGQQLHPLLGRPELEAMWKSFHQSVSIPLANADIPLAVTPGNHDASAYASFTLERKIYNEQWQARKPKLNYINDDHYPYYYAFSAGDTLFVSLDATRVGHLPVEQKVWLDKLLKANGQQYKQRVVFGHVPLWPFAVGREQDILGDHELESLLQQGSVDIFLNGHHHAYYPGHKNGINYISQACLGAGPRSLLGVQKKSKRSITIIEFNADGSFKLDALSAPDFNAVVDIKKLPKRIHTKWAEIIRYDLAAEK